MRLELGGRRSRIRRGVRSGIETAGAFNSVMTFQQGVPVIEG